MNRHKQLSIIILLIIIFLAVAAIKVQKSVTKEEYAAQVLDQYIKYFCPRNNICSQKAALNNLRLSWPNVYQAGFSILEDEKN
jgi:uncharacterized membrane protein